MGGDLEVVDDVDPSGWEEIWRRLTSSIRADGRRCRSGGAEEGSMVIRWGGDGIDVDPLGRRRQKERRM
jgi:hypothetical protein